jgi:hypothetical protein
VAQPRYGSARSKAGDLASRQEGATAEKAVPFSKLRLSIVILPRSGRPSGATWRTRCPLAENPGLLGIRVSRRVGLKWEMQITLAGTHEGNCFRQVGFLTRFLRASAFGQSREEPDSSEQVAPKVHQSLHQQHG